MVEPGRVGDRSHAGEIAMLEFREADDDVRDLDAEIVDVVLHLDRRVPKTEHARERVAKGGIAQMSDVRRLVGVDGGVLDDRLLGFSVGRRHLAAHPANQVLGTCEPEIEVAVRRDVDAGDAGNRTQCGGNVLRDDARSFS